MSTDFKQRTFMEMYLNGDVLADEIDDFIDQWHDNKTDLAIEIFLGLTQEEYFSWIENAETLRLAAAARKNGRTFIEEVKLISDNYTIAARGGKNSDYNEIIRWLKDTGRIK